MAEDDITNISAIQKANLAAKTQQAEQVGAVLAEAAEESLEEWGDQAIFNPLAFTKRFQTLEERLGHKAKSAEAKKTDKEEEVKVSQVEKIDETADSFQRRNPEMSKHVLILLQSKLGPDDTKETIIKTLFECFPDPYLADEALEFLLAATLDGPLKEKLKSVKTDLNALYGREIRSGRNIGAVSRKYALQGLGDPKALRNLYREITGNPKEPAVLFEEFAQTFDFDRLQPLIGFLLHSLGSDMKSKGPSISRPELQRLFTEARTMQAILGVYRFFKGRMPFIQKLLSAQGLILPPHINFEMISKLFVKFLLEKYPSASKLFQLAESLGISEELALQLIIYGQMRGALRNTSPKLFRNERHRHDLLTIYLEALEELEDLLEEEEEEES